MKKLLAVLTLCIASTSAFAQHHGHHGRYHGGYGWGWVAPAVIGGAVVYAATRPVVVPQQQPVVIVQQPQTLPPPPIGYRYETILDANCNCYRTVLVQ